MQFLLQKFSLAISVFTRGCLKNKVPIFEAIASTISSSVNNSLGKSSLHSYTKMWWTTPSRPPWLIGSIYVYKISQFQFLRLFGQMSAIIFASCKRIQDSLGFRIPRHAFRIQSSGFRIHFRFKLDFGFQLLAGLRIP